MNERDKGRDLFILFKVFVLMHVSVVYVKVCVWRVSAYMWKVEEDVGCLDLPLSISVYLFETGFFYITLTVLKFTM